ncbi:alpha/beta hydrolase [Oscillibacter sp. MSJ-2]|uniref:Alpha/beta hydrolase n=1 Tax=Dysosmobacter acutus TaxID=2841504 RepID=A0ABS6FC87_9FIRM|nr:alpha/beta hydrolase [Dysosmobacter acutus]MBU5627900.1 alpha/beta hydrolase [Dysosmobacter acutus]
MESETLQNRQQAVARRLERLNQRRARDRYFRPGGKSGTGTLLYLHGGGFVSGDGAYMESVAGLIAGQTGRCVRCVDYRLAPEHPCPAAAEDAEAACLALWREGTAPEKTAFVGDSSGGGLALALCQRLRDSGLPLPAGWIALSPWVDLTRTCGGFDGFLSGEDLARWAEQYGGKLELRAISPLFGGLAGLPPALLFAGGEELLRSDAERLCQGIIDAGGRCELTVAPGKGHCYVLAGGNQARADFARMRAFLDDVLRDTVD